jgi:hypothetical protein
LAERVCLLRYIEYNFISFVGFSGGCHGHPHYINEFLCLRFKAGFAEDSKDIQHSQRKKQRDYDQYHQHLSQHEGRDMIP